MTRNWCLCKRQSPSQVSIKSAVSRTSHGQLPIPLPSWSIIAYPVVLCVKIGFVLLFPPAAWLSAGPFWLMETLVSVRVETESMSELLRRARNELRLPWLPRGNSDIWWARPEPCGPWFNAFDVCDQLPILFCFSSWRVVHFGSGGGVGITRNELDMVDIADAAATRAAITKKRKQEGQDAPTQSKIAPTAVGCTLYRLLVIQILF